MTRQLSFWPFLIAVALVIGSCGKDEATAPVQTDNPAATGTFAQVATVQGPADVIASLAVSPDRKTIAFGTFADNSVRLVDVATRQVTRTMTGHTNRVTALAFSPDSRTLASTGTVNLTPSDGSVRTWDVTTGTQLAATATSGTSQLAFTPSGSLLAGASGGDPLRIQIWSPGTLSLQRTISGVFRFVAISPDGSRIVAGARNSLVYIMDLATGNQIATYSGHTGWITGSAFSNDGQMLATTSDDQTIRIWNSQTGVLTRTLSGHTTYPEFACFSPDGATLASLGTGSTITRTSSATYFTIGDSDRFPRLWNLGTGEELTRLDVGTDVVSEIAISPDWRLLATGNKTGIIRIFQR